MVGDNTTLQGGLVAAITLFAINTGLRLLVFKSKRAEKFFEGDPITLIYKGKVLYKHLEKEKITLEELHATVREHGVENISEVDLAILEVDGNISVLSNNFSHKTTKQRKHHKALNQNL